ncbi:unnamed protein product, partial [Medioppia subpectinata]
SDQLQLTDSLRKGKFSADASEDVNTLKNVDFLRKTGDNVFSVSFESFFGGISGKLQIKTLNTDSFDNQFNQWLSQRFESRVGQPLAVISGLIVTKLSSAKMATILLKHERSSSEMYLESQVRRVAVPDSRFDYLCKYYEPLSVCQTLLCSSVSMIEQEFVLYWFTNVHN